MLTSKLRENDARATHALVRGMGAAAELRRKLGRPVRDGMLAGGTHPRARGEALLTFALRAAGSAPGEQGGCAGTLPGDAQRSKQV